MIPLKGVILLLGTLSLVGSNKVDLKKCPQRNGLFPKPGSFCKAYYRCSNYNPVEEICPDYQLFNPVTSWCDWIYAFPCLDKPEREECPKDEGRFLKPGTGCKVYYDCCNGQPTEKECPPDQLFDPNKEKCEWFELYTCIEQPESKVCQKENGRFLKPGTDCKIYYDCRYGKPTEKACLQDQLFDSSKGRCDWRELVTCIDKPIQDKCFKDNGRFLKPGSHCKLYFDCRDGKPTERACPDDELFDPSTESCEWSELYTCVEDLSTNIPTVSTISTEFETSIPTTSDDNQNYKTSDKTPPTSSQPSTQSRTTVHTSTSGFSDYETTSQPNLSTTSSYTTSDQYIRSSKSELSSTHSSTSGTSDNKSTRKPRTSTISYSSSDPNIRSSTSKLGLSSTYSSTSGTSDNKSTRKPHTSTISYTSSDPNIRSSTSKLGLSSTHSSTFGTSDNESTRIPHTSTISYTSSDPNIRSSTSKLELSSTHSSTFGTSDYESTRKPHTSTISYTSSDPNIRSSTRGFRSSLPEMRSTTTVDIICPEPNGYFPHPTDKHKFVGCVNNVPNIMDCPSNLVYNHKKRQCDYKRR